MINSLKGSIWDSSWLEFKPDGKHRIMFSHGEQWHIISNEQILQLRQVNKVYFFKNSIFFIFMTLLPFWPEWGKDRPQPTGHNAQRTMPNEYAAIKMEFK